MHSSPHSIEPEGLFDGLKPGAIFLGAVVDNLATVLVSIALVAVLGPEEIFSEDEMVSQAAFDALSSEPEFLLWSLVLGIGCTVLGAYVGARRAGQFHVRHGGWVAVASAALGLVSLLMTGGGPGPTTPLWYEATGWVLLLPAGLLGGALSKSHQVGHAD
jgi:hypothetical protein